MQARARSKFWTLIAYAVSLALVFVCGAISPVHSQELKTAPDFALRTLERENVRLSELRGEVVLMNFWASWCGECRSAIRPLSELHSKYEKAGLTMLSVSIDDVQHATEAVRALHIEHSVLLDEHQEVSKLYAVNHMPLTLLIDREGRVRYALDGYRSGDEQQLLEKVRALLNE